MGETAVPLVGCPQCGTLVAWSTANPWRPFCCARCKLIDLGAWAAESYRVPVAGDPSAAESDLPQ